MASPINPAAPAMKTVVILLIAVFEKLHSHLNIPEAARAQEKLPVNPPNKFYPFGRSKIKLIISTTT